MKKMDKNSHSSGGLWQKQVRIMKLCFILTFIGILHLSAATYSQDTRLDLKVKNASLESVMNDIRTQSEYSFFFDDIAVKKISNITLDLKGATIEEVLATCLKNTGILVPSSRQDDYSLPGTSEKRQKETIHHSGEGVGRK